MRVGETVIESGGIVIPLGKKEMMRRIGAAGLILRVRVEKWHVGQFDMARTNLEDSGMPPRKRARDIIINEGEAVPSKMGKQAPPKGGKGKGKAPVAKRPEDNSCSDGESAQSQPLFLEPEDD
uniref:Uncharacterized protein n=1 Tax=Solanum tuberosum TaxID=4113 RepID=M1DLX2_SOLTU